MKIYDNTFKTTLTRKGSEVIVIAIKISSASYIVLNWYLLGVEMNLANAHKTRFWYLLGVFSKMPDEHPRHFIREYPRHGSRFTMQRTLRLRGRALIYPGHTNRRPFLLQEGEILKVLYTSRHF